MDSAKVVILDIRYPTLPIAEPQRHQGCVNAVAWAPHSSAHICTAGDDCQVRVSTLGGNALSALVVEDDEAAFAGLDHPFWLFIVISPQISGHGVYLREGEVGEWVGCVG